MVCRTWSLQTGVYASGLCSFALLPETSNPTKSCVLCVEPTGLNGGCTNYIGKILVTEPWPTEVLGETWRPLLQVNLNLPSDSMAYYEPWWRGLSPLGGTAELACHADYTGTIVVRAKNTNCEGWASSEPILYPLDCTPYTGTPRVEVTFPVTPIPGEYIYVIVRWRSGIETKRAIFRKYLPERLSASCASTHAMTEWRHDDSGSGSYVPLPLGASVSVGPLS